jgi:hypothetical protein
VTSALEGRLHRLARLIVGVLLAAQAVRLVTSVVAGITTVKQSAPGGIVYYATGPKIAAFGGAGDGVGVLLLAVAVVVLWLTVPAWDDRSLRQSEIALWLIALTAADVVVHAVGVSVEVTEFPQGQPWGQLVEFVGFDAAYLVVAVGCLSVLRGLSYVADEAVMAGDDDTVSPVAVFAVDRRNGDVLAWPSMSTAVAEAPVYGVEDNEYEFFLDDGTVLSAGVVDDRVNFSPTGVDRSDDLLAALRAYAERTGITVDAAEADEPLAYVDPVSRAHWLDNWPGWLRWVGRIARPPR